MVLQVEAMVKVAIEVMAEVEEDHIFAIREWCQRQPKTELYRNAVQLFQEVWGRRGILSGQSKATSQLC